eukprot:GILI01033374.1.p1 GENE.GILI01033374.1~~GILI01033374.1.p1  ORF type:complete len:372 (+),score=35.70 GILI01033374.1:22-1137(+)
MKSRPTRSTSNDVEKDRRYPNLHSAAPVSITASQKSPRTEQLRENRAASGYSTIKQLRLKIQRLSEAARNTNVIPPSQLPSHILMRHGLLDDRGAVRTRRADASSLFDAYIDLLDEAQRSAHVPLDPEVESHFSLVATDMIFSEVIRQVAAQCSERGKLLQHIRETLFEHIQHAPIADSPRRQSKESPQLALQHTLDKLAATEGRLKKTEQELAHYKAECERMTRLNGLLSLQRTHESVYQRAISLTSDSFINRRMVLEAAAKAALELKKVRCETTGEVDALLLLHERGQRINQETQTSEVDIFMASLGYSKGRQVESQRSADMLPSLSRTASGFSTDNALIESTVSPRLPQPPHSANPNSRKIAFSAFSR